MKLKEAVSIQDTITTLTEMLNVFIIPYLKAYYNETKTDTFENHYGDDFVLSSVKVEKYCKIVSVFIEGGMDEWDIINIPFDFILKESLNK